MTALTPVNRLSKTRPSAQWLEIPRGSSGPKARLRPEEIPSRLHRMAKVPVNMVKMFYKPQNDIGQTTSICLLQFNAAHVGAAADKDRLARNI